VRPDAYLMIAAGQRLYAPALEELAEIAECAIEAEDEIERLGVRTPEGWRALDREKFGRFVGLLAARIQPPAAQTRGKSPGGRSRRGPPPTDGG
jgi:hypothetical protein